MAAEVVDLLIPRNHGSAGRRQVESDRRLLQQYILVRLF
jgi:hypothetical protein